MTLAAEDVTVGRLRVVAALGVVIASWMLVRRVAGSAEGRASTHR